MTNKERARLCCPNPECETRIEKALNEAEARGRKSEGERAVAILRDQAERIRPGTLVSYHIAADVLEIELRSPLGTELKK